MNEKIFDSIVQAIGYVGLLCNVIAYQGKKHRQVMVWKTLTEGVFVAQYLLLGAITGAAMNAVGSVRNIVFARLVEKKKSTLAMQILFGLFFCVFGALTWQGPISLLTIGAKVITTVAYGCRNTKTIRFLTLPSSVAWMTYNAVSGSVGGVMCEGFATVSILVAILRYDVIEPRKRKALNRA